MNLSVKRALAGIILSFFISSLAAAEDMSQIKLPKPRTKGGLSVEEAIRARRSVRSYGPKEISLEDLSQLLWACQGVTDEKRGHRAAPSAGALYPLEVYIVKKDGIFRYLPDTHSLQAISGKDARRELAAASLGQEFVAQVPVDIVICAVPSRITTKYGERGIRYTDMEAGHAAENLFLQAEALGLSSVPVGAFNDVSVARLLGLPDDTKPLYILPVGYKKN